MGLPQASFCGFIAAITFTLCASPLAHADMVQVAVAANFVAPLKALASTFEKDTGHTVSVSSGGTAKLYAQIKNGAPFDVFLSADNETPQRLQREGHGVAGTGFTYAVGRLALWSPNASLVDAKGDILQSGNFSKIALASPKAAPYGEAAVQTLRKLGLLNALQPKFVVGESIGQAFSFVATGNAEIGFVALSQVMENGKLKSGSMWLVPSALHDALVQDAVLLIRAKTSPSALAFLAYLKTDAARSTIRSFGYETQAL